MEMNGWLALAIVMGASVAMKVLKKKGIAPRQNGSQTPAVSQAGSYKVRLNDAGYEKIKAIKEYREFTGVGLKEAKDMIEAAPCVMLETEDYQKACRMAEIFRGIGADVTIIGDENNTSEYSSNYSQSQTYKVYLHSDGGEKVKAIKVYRDYTGEGLKESKDKIDSAPCTMLVTTDYQKARRMADEFGAFGASVSIYEE